MLEADTHKKFNFRATPKLEYCKLYYFGQTAKLKCHESLNCENKMSRYSKLVKKNREIKMSRKFHALKYCLFSRFVLKRKKAVPLYIRNRKNIDTHSKKNCESRGKCMGLPINFTQYGKIQQTPLCRESLGNWYLCFSQSMSGFLPSDSHPTVHYTRHMETAWVFLSISHKLGKCSTARPWNRHLINI